MGPLFVVIFWAVLLTPIGFGLGLLLSFIGFPVFHTLKRTPVDERNTSYARRRRVASVFTVLFVPTICGLGLYLSYKDEGDYWEYQGAFDFWRMPLEEPYELVMIDVTDEAAISEWQDGTNIVSGIRKYEKRGHLVAGYYEREFFNSKESGWFLFDCASGRAEKFGTEQSLTETCATRGFSPPIQMKTIHENWTLYWKNPNRRRE